MNCSLPKTKAVTKPKRKPKTKPPAPKPTKSSKSQSAKDKAQDARRRAIYNISSEEYEAVLAYQNGRCAITGRLPATLSLAIDHDHRTGLIRGLLGNQANKGLALFQDNPEWLRRAADYLENPPVTTVIGEPVYGVQGRVTKKAKNRKYGPDGTKTPQPRTFKLSTSQNNDNAKSESRKSDN